MELAVTFDYRCPFARNAHEALIEAARDDLDVRFLAFSLDQTGVEEGRPAVWERPEEERGSGVLALTWGIAVRDAFPEAFGNFHRAAFAIRHDDGQRFTDETLRAAATAKGLDSDAVAAVVATGGPLETLANEHTEAVERWEVFGVPTFIRGDLAAFVRLMERGRIEDLERVLELLEWSSLNEFKHTRIPR
jgi:2-hydroxychromene-2-carboxylate isomerase